MIRPVLLALLACAVVAEDVLSMTTGTIAGAEIVTVAVPASWSSAIIMSTERDHVAEHPERVLINGGYFDLQGQPDGFLLNGKIQSGRLRHDKPYSGFLWCDTAGVMHIARIGDPIRSTAGRGGAICHQ